MQDSETSWMEQPLFPSPTPLHTHTWWLLQDNSLSTRTMKLNRPSLVALWLLGRVRTLLLL